VIATVRGSRTAGVADVEAVLADPAQLAVALQPVVDLSTGRVAGYEALARFPFAPDRPTAEWFSLAHRVGLGVALEVAALRTALSVPGRPEGTYLSVNLSPSALPTATVAAVLPRDLDGIVLEVTEQEDITDSCLFARVVAELRRRGARIAIDDTGAGYAGLQRVTQISSDLIKLDRSLVSGVHSDPAKVALIESFVRFARRTGASVCAEGIECLEELVLLADLDVAYGQGYALARPGSQWPTVDARAVEACRRALHRAMGTSGPGPSLADDGERRLERVSADLAQATSLDDLATVLPNIAAALHAQDVVFSVLDAGRGCVEAIMAERWRLTGERFYLADYPATAQVLRSHEALQTVVGDLAADPAEVLLLEASGFRSLLMVPVLSHGAPIGLLEAYCAEARSWTRAEINRARIICHQLGPVIDSFGHVQRLRVTA